jgi:hypothetical protein
MFGQAEKSMMSRMRPETSREVTIALLSTSLWWCSLQPSQSANEHIPDHKADPRLLRQLM